MAILQILELFKKKISFTFSGSNTLIECAWYSAFDSAPYRGSITDFSC